MNKKHKFLKWMSNRVSDAWNNGLMPIGKFLNPKWFLSGEFEDGVWNCLGSKKTAKPLQ